jgi:hypothetical protein
MNTLFQLPELKVTEYRTIEMAIDAAALRYGQAADIERQAWEMWSEGVDAGYTYEATDDLLKHALFAESICQQAQKELDEAKALLLAVLQ